VIPASIRHWWPLLDPGRHFVCWNEWKTSCCITNNNQNPMNIKTTSSCVWPLHEMPQRTWKEMRRCHNVQMWWLRLSIAWENNFWTSMDILFAIINLWFRNIHCYCYSFWILNTKHYSLTRNMDTYNTSTYSLTRCRTSTKPNMTSLKHIEV
jgi:hypothetical protein